MRVIAVRDQLMKVLSEESNVFGAAQTSDMTEELIPGRSDLDIFVLCADIPTVGERKRWYRPYAELCSSCAMNVCEGGMWGAGDILAVDGIDVMFMYFTVGEMETYLDEVLAGDHLDREGGFYPTGRLSSVEGIQVLFERNEVWSRMRAKVKDAPQELFDKLFRYHGERILDEEDLGRALLRKDVLFYHQVLEHALDHFLQALFAKNRVYFPSRKRSCQYIDSFTVKPVNCLGRLHTMVQNGAAPESIENSVRELRKLTADLIDGAE